MDEIEVNCHRSSKQARRRRGRRRI
uniref:Uncharacterized protein n=1 Tax=Arundo donax TaxID=35708 RepID=A0A0A9CBM1_ARUDO